MEPGLLRDALIVALGVATGVLSGAFGVGGAVISTPGIRALGVPALLAVGTTLPSILPSAVSGTVRYLREGLIVWPAVLWTVPAGIVASVGGSLLSQVVPGDGHPLQILTAALLAVTSVRMAADNRRRSVPAPDAPDAGAALELADEPAPATSTADGGGRWRFAVVGVAAGLLSGLLGIGGGVVMVPGFTQVARMPVKSAIATSLVCVGAFAVPGTITHALLDNVDWRVALLLTIGVIPGARLGATLAIRTTDRRLRQAVALMLGLIALVYAAGELLALAA